MHDCRDQWSRDNTASRRLGPEWSRGSTEKKIHRIWGTVVVHSTSSAAKFWVAVGTTVAQQTYILIFSRTIPSWVTCSGIPQNPSHCFLRGQWRQAGEFIGEQSVDLLCFLMKASFVLVPVMVVCWSEVGQRSAYNQTVCCLDRLDLHLESLSGE
ncbi:uncharacterized protein TNCV_2814231 [Trichonephila clavipes]|nr:uncharacterized protein TNCV_2814231 [Trichonephila clavipes]